MCLPHKLTAILSSAQQRRAYFWLPLLMGLMGGFILALTLVVMEQLSLLIWEHHYQQHPLVIFGIFAVGGLLIGLLQQKLTTACGELTDSGVISGAWGWYAVRALADGSLESTRALGKSEFA